MNNKHIRILVSNDDGVYAPGIAALVKALETVAEVFVMAPDRDRSGASHSLTIDRPIRVTALDNGFYSASGTPKDCVHLAVTGWLTEPPHMVVSGVNNGSNLGDDVIYSGTVAAAMEGCFLGIPSIAVSLFYQNGKAIHFDTAAKVALELVQNHIQHPLPSGTLLNVNVPDIPYDQLKGIRVTRLGNRNRAEPIIQSTDPHGRTIYWVGESGPEQEGSGTDTDFYAIKNHYVSLTPLKTDLTHYPSLDIATNWCKGVM